MKDFMYDGAHIIKVLDSFQQGERTVYVGRWITKTGKLYLNGTPYMIVDHNVIFEADTVDEMYVKIGKVSRNAILEGERDIDFPADFVYMVKKTVTRDGVSKQKIESIYHSENMAISAAKKIFKNSMQMEGVIADKSMKWNEKNVWQIVYQDKQVKIEVVEKVVKD